MGDGSAFGIQTTYIHQAAPLGLAHAVLVARDFLGDDDFVMYLGDNFIVGGISAADRRVPGGAAGRADHAHPGLRSARLRRRGARRGRAVIGLEEKPQQPKSNLALVGIYMFTPAIHEAVRRSEAVLARRARDHRGDPVADRHRHRPSARPSSPATGMTPATSPTCSRSTGWCWSAWSRSARRRLTPHSELIGRVVVEEGAQVSGSRIVGPVDHRGGHQGHGHLHRPVHRRSRTTARRRQRDRVLDRVARRVDPGRAPDRGLHHRAPRGGHPGPQGAPRLTASSSATTAKSRSPMSERRGAVGQD